MSISPYFLRPQPLRRRSENDGKQAISELVELVVLLVREQTEGGAAAQKIGQALQAGAESLRADLETRLQNSGGEIRDWFQPVLDTVQAGLAAGDHISSWEGFVSTLDVILRLAKQSLDHLTVDELAAQLNELLDIFENDLGLSQRRFEAWFADFIEAVVSSLTADYLTGNTSQEALRQFHIGAKISGLRGYLLDLTAQIPLLDRRALVRDLAAAMQERNWDVTIEKIKEYGDKATEALNHLPGRGTDSGTNSGNAPTSAARSARMSEAPPLPARRDNDSPGGAEYSWYASWLEHTQFGFDSKSFDDRFDATGLTLGGRVSYREVSPDKMEHLAHWSAVSSNLLEVIPHLISNESGDRANNFSQAGWQALHGLVRALLSDHHDETSKNFLALWENYIFHYGLASGIATLGSLENYPGSGEAWLKANFLPDLGETLLYAIWANHARHFLLSTLTLHNYDPANPQAENYKHVDGFVLPFVHLGIIGAALLPRVLWEGKKHYGWPLFDGAGAFFTLGFKWGVLGMGLPFLTGLGGWAIGGALAGGKMSDTYWGDKAWWQNLSLGFVLWPVYTYLIWDGATGDGTNGVDTSGNEVDFPGYPDPDTSPYKLPFPKDKMHQCVQGHHGIWSHNLKTEQTYAVDFSHDQGDDVVAMRGGTVTSDTIERIQDGKTERDNHVTVRHDDTDEPAGVHAAHDRDQMSAPSPTAAIYVHGQHYGVRFAFALRGVPKQHIVGSQVAQGQLVMLAGDTGISQYNHLHAHVSSPHARSVPYVFRDVRERGGVVKAFNYYISENADPMPHLNHVARFVPEHEEGVSFDAGDDYLILEQQASDRNGHYTDCHLLVKFEKNDLTCFQYKKIRAYDGEARKASIEGGWDATLPNGGIFFYKIGGKPYESADLPLRRFAHLAARNASGQPQPFADQRPAFTVSKVVSRYHLPATEGRAQAEGQIGNNALTLESGASNVNDAYAGRHIALFRGGQMVQYRKISSYDGAARRVFIEGVWERALQTGADGDHYLIGGPDFQNARVPDSAALERGERSDRDYAYLGANGVPNAPPLSPTVNGDAPPYPIHTYPFWQKSARQSETDFFWKSKID